MPDFLTFRTRENEDNAHLGQIRANLFGGCQPVDHWQILLDEDDVRPVAADEFQTLLAVPRFTDNLNIRFARKQALQFFPFAQLIFGDDDVDVIHVSGLHPLAGNLAHSIPAILLHHYP